MKDIGSVNHNPPSAPQREMVHTHRAERTPEKDSVTVSRTPQVETRQTFENRGAQETRTDSRGEQLTTRPAAKVRQETTQAAHTIQYTQQATPVTTNVADESRSLLDMRA